MSEGYHFPTSQFGLTTDPRTSNQVKEVSNKLSTGAKTIELSLIQTNILESIPRQHFKEINRLKKLVGADLTFHGPLVEPTGITQNGWEPSQREQAERQMWNSLERAHDVDPDGNIVVTFHTSNGLPEPRTRIKTKDGKEISTGIAVIDERTGRFGALPRPKEDYFTGEKADPDTELKKLNEQNWTQELNNVNIAAIRGRERFDRLNVVGRENREIAKKLDLEKLYQTANTEEGKRFMSSLDPETKKVAEDLVDEMNYGAISIKDSYIGFKSLYNQAYSAAQTAKDKDSIKKLEAIKKEVTPLVGEYDKDPYKVKKLSQAISKGIEELGSMNPPQVFQPIEKFAIDKASETFSNLAFSAYNKFGNTAPVISIENPPAGMGLSRADEIRELIKESRNKFTQKLMENRGLSEDEAKRQAEKLIGATWDVGHINMIRKYGYDAEDVVKESKIIAPYVKHVHLSDNFGLDHTELPMGMGNVPTKKILELQEQFKNAKKIVETGGPWYQFFQRSPLSETMRAFGSPIYAMEMAPSWNYGTSGGYFVGQGATLPEQHFSLYGSGFSNLPTELGGQMAGRSRMGGAPIE